MRSSFYRLSAAPARAARVALVGLILLVPAWAAADRIHFTDGESITGVLVSIDSGKVKWQSAILGELEVEQRYIEYIESGDRFDLKLTGEEMHNCWMFIQRDSQHLHCDEGVQPLADWKLVIAAGETLVEPQPLVQQRGNVTLALDQGR